jgi:hypothetical protein
LGALEVVLFSQPTNHDLTIAKRICVAVATTPVALFLTHATPALAVFGWPVCPLPTPPNPISLPVFSAPHAHPLSSVAMAFE